MGNEDSLQIGDLQRGDSILLGGSRPAHHSWAAIHQVSFAVYYDRHGWA